MRSWEDSFANVVQDKQEKPTFFMGEYDDRELEHLANICEAMVNNKVDMMGRIL